MAANQVLGQLWFALHVSAVWRNATKRFDGMWDATYGPSDHVKMWEKPQERTSFSAAARDCGMILDISSLGMCVYMGQ